MTLEISCRLYGADWRFVLSPRIVWRRVNVWSKKIGDDWLICIQNLTEDRSGHPLSTIIIRNLGKNWNSAIPTPVPQLNGKYPGGV